MKLNHFLIGLVGISIIILFAGCEKDDEGYDVPPADGRVIGSIHGIVQDNYSKERIAGAVVQYVVSGNIKSVTTDSLGYYFIKGLGTGEYELSVLASSNYAKGKTVIYIPSIEEVAGPNPSLKNYDVSLVGDIQLFSLNAGAKGTLYARDESGNLQTVANATIMVRFSESTIEPAVFSTVTDNEGNFIFDHCLPAYNNYYTLLYSLPFNINGIDYNAVSTSNIYLTPEVNIRVENMIATISTSDVMLLSSPLNQNNIDPAANMQFIFSKSINVQSVNIELRRNDYYGTMVYCEETWGANNTSLTMNPYALLRENTSYYFNIEGKTADNSSFQFNGYFTTSGSQQELNMIHTNLETIEGIYTDSFPVYENIELIFNNEVDTLNSTFTLNEETYPYNTVPCAISLSSDKKTVTINPVENLNYNFYYHLYYFAYSEAGYSTSSNIYFSTQGQ